MGYTASAGVYLPAAEANRTIIWIDSASATLYAGTPDGSSHRALTTLASGQYYVVSGLNTGEVLSVQAGSGFDYQIYIAPPPAPEIPQSGTDADYVTWQCTGYPCPWGTTNTGYALPWPASANPVSSRLGYTTSVPVYLGASRANGTTIQVFTGTVSLYAGEPNGGSHRLLATVAAGGSYEVSGLASGEVLSAQSGFNFNVGFDIPPAVEEPPAPEEPPVPEEPPASATAPFVTWNCTSAPCPWGPTDSGYALAWPTGAPAISTRLGYTTSIPTYLSTPVANGTVIEITSGEASVYAGLPQGSSHRRLATVYAGDSYLVEGLAAGEVISVQAGSAFGYIVTLGEGSSTDPEPDPETDPEPPVQNPDLMYSQAAKWFCDVDECYGEPWTGQVVNWPSWAAYANNARAGNMSRSVFDAADGTPLTPYMGSWANGCVVTAHQGVVLVIDRWERGSDTWRETYLIPGETHVIELNSPGDSALIESNDYFADFAVSVSNCTPQPLQ